MLFRSLKRVGIDIARALIKGAKWPEVAALLKTVDEEPETIRRIVLGYFGTVSLSKPNPIREIQIMECFEQNYYNSGKAGLILSCASAVFAAGK